ncbi:MAG: L-histidine N(alpha)-methyltransferase, partial [Acidobacteria bacterium]|nr:L-histidine N(alpha)-methyltransferase [Acidobacteriota bacterium]
EIEPMAGDYFTAHFPDFSGRRVWLYMGSNIGNLTDQQAKDLLANLRDSAQADDLLCIGYDLKKDPARILAAYNDPQGVTRAFNLNLLERMNRELDANFDPNHFQHVPIYDPEKAEARSYLMSTTDQEVTIGALGLTFMFEAWETILTEISRKFNARQMAELCGQCGWKRVRDLRDAAGDYAISLYRA